MTHLEWTGRLDGQDYPIQGIDEVLTNAYTRVDDRTYDIVVKVDGSRVATARIAIAADGKTLTTVTTSRNALGKTVRSTVVYERQ
jgi:succinyl-CoA synthetase beta subunit